MSGPVYALNLLNLANLHPQREKGASDHLRHLFDKPDHLRRILKS